jgi:DMSO/TMAO reductase YedYZ molybdopterin-dependent catalytic subunit
MPETVDDLSTSRPDPSASGRAATLARGAAAGLLAGAASVAVSEGLAALLDGVTSPLLAVGNRFIDLTPRPLKELAVETFGAADKAVLLGSVLGTVALLAVVVGAVGVRRPRTALGAFLVLAVVAAAAALFDRAATAGPTGRLLPALALAVVGLLSLHRLLRALRFGAPSPGADARPARTTIAPTPAAGSAAPSGPAGPRKPRLLLDHPGDDLPTGFDRRAFLQSALAVGAVGAVGVGVREAFGGSAAAAQRATVTLPRPVQPAPPLPPGAQLRVPGITPHLTPNGEFYRVDTALRVPDVPIDGYTLRVRGMVERDLTLSFEDLLGRRLVERRITLTCVSNPVGGEYAGTATWLGVPVRDLLREAGVRPGADAVRSTSADDMTIGTPLSALDDPRRDALIAVGMNGRPLPLAHGFPVRMVVPGLYGYVSATKWLVDLEVTRFADFEAYWTSRGYAEQAPIKTAARIDVPRSFQEVAAGPVQVAGVAWAQHRGIRSVEVRVDGGPWQSARLAAEDGIDTWRQWTWTWDADPGSHKLEVRATDHDGATQTAERAPIAPDGATGWHGVDVTAT